MNCIFKYFKILTLSEKNIDSYKKYKYKNIDNSFLTPFYNVFWNYCQIFIPSFIHPNIITLSGLISIIISYYFSNYKYSNYIMAFGTFFYFTVDAIDGIHARKTKQSSIIGEYVDHLIDHINMGIITDALLNQFGMTNIFIKNVCISTFSFAYATSHVEALDNKCLVFDKCTDVTLMLTVITLLFTFNVQLPEFLLNYYLWFNMFASLNFYIIHRILKNITHYKYIYTRYIVIFYYLLKIYTLQIYPEYNFWKIATVDILLLLNIINTKVFETETENLLLLIPMFFIINSNITTFCVIIYILLVILQFSYDFKLNLFYNKKIPKKVYCCGVFDLCHLGHMILFENIVKSFDEPIELIVGIHSDEECRGYKREPILNEDIRCETVEHCKYVDKIIKNVPLVVSKELIAECNIDCVIIGEEYRDNNDYKWYGVAMDMGIEKYIPRYDKLSSSDIINKIKLE
jgi:cytidyltransferase-like protein